ncbi:two-component system VirA-like sensor kinase [Rhizobium aegyptiacum]|uniref:two-component system VirA-like sensor kinase n=1 Tax=Rhizobium aegyptiacum TaxID=1764550 RepID=UPI0007E53FDC|nr:two-component system VirA-like sensor kinase [Rhizobium aegyptiacum]
MDISSKRRPRRATIELWRIVLLVSGAFCFALLAIGRVPSRETHEAILTSLRAIDINHASLQRDVLQARAGLLTNYDPLVDSIINLHVAVTRLRGLFDESGIETTAELDTELSKIAASIDSDEALVERFKTDNALLQNSLSIANQMLSELHASSDPVVTSALAMANDLGNLMMRFTAQPDASISTAIRSQLTMLSQSDAAGVADVRSYVAHANMVLDTLPSVDNTIEAIQASRTSEAAQVLQEKYLSAYGMASVRSAWTRLLLGSVSVLLCVYIAILVYRLRAQTHRLTQQLDLENLVADIRKRFNEDFDDVRAAVQDSLMMLAHFFDASKYAFAVVNNVTREADESFGNADESAFRALIQRLSAQMTASMKDEQLHWDRFYYHNLQQSDIQSFPEGVLSAGSVAATSIDHHSFGFLFLEHREVRKKPDADELRLLGHAVVVLAQCIKSQKDKEEKLALEARLEHSQRLEAVGTLAGGIAHEFNNTLGAILGYGEMALQLDRNPARTRQYIREIVASGQRAKHIIDQILTFSRKRARISRPFSLTEAIDDIIPLVRLSIPDKVKLSTNVAEALPAIFGNPIEIQQVIMNLCTNAAQAAGDEGQISISAEQINVESKLALSHGELPAGSYVVVSVEDNGKGIAPSVLPHIFEPFFTTKSNTGGTGLGLAAVHGHVTGMNGRIDVASRQGQGTCFGLYFPFVSDEPIPLAQFFNERTVPLGSGQTVLLAQRDTNLRLMYEEKIAALGYEPIGFSSLPSLKRWLSAGDRHCDLIVLDADLWSFSPDFRQVVSEFAPLATLFLADPERDSLDPRASPDISVLRKPVSSMNLASALFNLIGGRSQNGYST